MTNLKCSTNWRAVCASVVALQLVVAPGVALAAPANAKVIAVLVASAKKAFDAGEFERAGELFLQVYKQDPTDPVALLNAGRAYQFAGKLERAKSIYVELLGLGSLPDAVRGKAEGWKAEIVENEAQSIADAADAADKAAKFAQAAQLWSEAARANPKKVIWKFREARSWHLAGSVDKAAQAYDAFLAVASADVAERADAERYRAELAAGRVSGAGGSEPRSPPPVVKPEAARVTPSSSAPAAENRPASPGPTGSSPAVRPPEPSANQQAPKVYRTEESGTPSASGRGSRIAGHILTGLGGAMALGGLALYSLAGIQKSKIQAQLDVKPVTAEAVAAAETHNLNAKLGPGFLAAGLATIGLGIWLKGRGTQSSVAIVPSGHGVVVAGEF